MLLTFRPIKVWPDSFKTAGADRPRSPFSGSYADTLDILDRELVHLGCREVTLQVDASDRDVRLDGQLRADAKVNHPGVILTIESRAHGSLVYATDRFQAPGYRGGPGWQHNLRAIALGLEALRKVERYGIAERGQQYAGYRELGSGIAVGPGAMTVEQAARFIAEHAGDPGWLVEVAEDPAFALSLYKDAAKALHPDVGGDPDLFKRLGAAKAVLEAAFG